MELMVKSKAGRYVVATTEQIMQAANEIVENKFHKGFQFTSERDTSEYLFPKLAHLEHEVFTVLFLNTKHQLIECCEMFRGSIASASVHPREIAKKALQLNAAAVILAHNHPSGEAKPSAADHTVTKAIKDALTLLEVRTLDHIIVAGKDSYSFANHGCI